MPKKKPTKKATARPTKSAAKKRSRRAATAAAPKELVATVKSSALYKLLRDEGIKKKKANRIVRAATAPIRAAVGVVESLPSAPTGTFTKTTATKSTARKTATKTAAKATTKAAGRTAPSSLENLTKADLQARARTANIAGRSAMSKDELVAALRRG